VSVDPRAASGFGSRADAYERARPSYPPELVARVVRELGLTAGSHVLDLAAGTGKLTRRLVPLVGSVVAVDASRAMLGELAVRLPEVEVRAGAAEAIPLADGAVEAVFAGQAFHWFRTAPAAREIARVLSPRGGLALLWNRARWSEQDHPWMDRFDELLIPRRRAAGSFPDEDRWQPALEETGLFEPLSHAEADHVHRVTPDDLVTLVASWSWIANLPEQERGALLDEVRALVAGHAELELLYRTECYWARVSRL
jgi:SAM-dependent methyltransferase